MDAKQCRCPVRPFYSPGSMGSGSTHEDAMLDRWEVEHGGHPYARARDALATHIEAAERDVRSGPAVLDMVADIFNQPRQSKAPTLAGEGVAPKPEGA